MRVQWTVFAEEQFFALSDRGGRFALIAARLLTLAGSLAEFPDLGEALPGAPPLRQLLVEGARLVYARTAEVCEIITVLAPGQSLRLGG